MGIKVQDQANMKGGQQITFSHNQSPMLALIIGAHPDNHSFSGHPSPGFHVEYYLQLLFREGLLCLPAQRARSTWSLLSYSLPRAFLISQWPVQTYFPCLDEFRMHAGVIHTVELLYRICLRLVLCLKLFSSLAPSLSLSLFLSSLIGFPEEHFLNKTLDQQWVSESPSHLP